MRREKRIAAAKAFPSRGRWHCEAMTDEVGRGVLLQPCGNAVRQSTQHSRGVMATRSCHLISRLAPTASPRGEADGSAESSTFAGKSLPLAARRKATSSRKKLQRRRPPALKARPHFYAKKARPTAKANEKGRWNGWKLAMKGRGRLRQRPCSGGFPAPWPAAGRTRP